MSTPVVRVPKDWTTRTGPQAEAKSMGGSQRRPCSGSVPRHTLRGVRAMLIWLRRRRVLRQAEANVEEQPSRILVTIR